MPRRTRNRRPAPTAPTQSQPNTVPMLFMGLLAGAIGALAMWYFLGGKSEPVRTVTAPITLPSEAAPNVAHLPPAEEVPHR